MKTLFDFNPTESELVELFGFDSNTKAMAFGFSIVLLPVADYEKENTLEGKLLDVAKLLELRGLKDEASEVWKKIRDIERQYRGGFDYEQVKR